MADPIVALAVFAGIVAALALMLGCLRRIPLFHAATRAGKGWALPVDIGEGCGEIRGRTVGLLDS